MDNMFVLRLNDMRSPNIEHLTTVCKANTSEELSALLESEKVDSYRDGNWGKRFKKDGRLEWYNEPFGIDGAIVDVGTEDDWAFRAREQYRDQIGNIPSI